MRIVNRFVDRPLPIFLMAAMMTFVGLWCLNDLPVKRNPKVEIPFNLVVVPYAGAAPEDVESEITMELEDGLSTLDDVRHMVSISKHGVSTVFLEFEDRTDMEESTRDVRTQVDIARAEFPDDADMPIVQEISFEDVPIIFFTISGSVDRYRLREIAEDLEPGLEAVPGVSRVDLFGGFEREVHILAKPTKLAQFGMTLSELADVIGSQSQSAPVGMLRGQSVRRMIRATGEFETLEELRSITVTEEGGRAIALRDVATIEYAHKRLTSGAWYNGENSVSLIVRRRPDVNTLETVRLLKAHVARIEAGLPKGVAISVSSDSSVEIAAMVRQLGMSALFGIVLVTVILIAVFGLRQALLVASVLPFALLFTFIGLRVFEMEISNVALFGLVLVLGLVVDGAIIVGEAIFAERESGESPRAAAKLGIERVGVPVIAADLTTIAAFLPMLLMVGIMGQYMSVIPKVVVFALIGSVFVDHFLLPAASAKFKNSRRASRVALAPDGLPWVSPEIPRIRGLYRRLLARALRYRWSVVGASALALALAFALAMSGTIKTIFLPTVDRGRFVVNYALPLGTPIEETNRVGELIMRDIASAPEVESYVLTTGDTGALNGDAREGGKQGAEYGKISVDLVKKGDRLRHQSEIVAELRERIRVYAGVNIDIEELSEGPPVGAALALRIKGDDLGDLADAAGRVKSRIMSLAGALDVRVDRQTGHPEVQVEVDRARAKADFGITPNQVSRTMHIAFEGVEVGRMWVRGQRVDLRLSAPSGFGQSVDAVRELPLRAGDGSLIPLGALARVDLAFGEDAIYRHDGMRTITLRSDVAAGVSSVDFEADARIALAGISLPQGVKIEFGGESEERDRSNSSLMSALKWGILAIYMIIAIQFNSIRQPFIVLVTIPLSLIGVVLGLLVTGRPFSFLVFIGIVALTGIVVNDGIVMVDGINRVRRSGMPLRDAILEAAASRLRPVILTTITTIAGLLPLTLGVGDGGEFWEPLGIAIISGILVASSLTLFVIPVLYVLLEEGPERRRVRVPALRHTAREVVAAGGGAVESVVFQRHLS